MEGASGDPMCNFKGIGTKLWKKKRISSSKQHAFSVVVEVERLFGVDQLTPISFPFERTTNIFNISGHRRGSKMALWATTDAQCGNVNHYCKRKRMSSLKNVYER